MFQSQIDKGFWLILALTVLLILYLFIEIYLHKKRLRQIKYRIHVNGTRGKSSVSRLIAAGLRGGDLKTVCKTTGTMARFIYPDGHEDPIIRLGRTNVIEQLKVVKKAVTLKPDALVIECMAVQPLLQSLCELKLVRSTHGVLVNAKEDHLDVMGPTELDVALALAGTMTIKGKFFTPEKKYLKVFKMAALDRGTELIEVNEEDEQAISDEELSKFPYLEYKSNVALALKVCQSIGVSREKALGGMWTAKPDPGALMILQKDYKGRAVTLANGFAANDPESTTLLWDKVIETTKPRGVIVALVNCREDRGDRSRQMAEVVNTWQRVDKFILIGSGTEIFLKHVDAESRKKCLNHDGINVAELLDVLVGFNGSQEILAIGVCNIAKIGFELLHYFFEEDKE